jgi:hypothetical protein
MNGVGPHSLDVDLPLVLGVNSFEMIHQTIGEKNVFVIFFNKSDLLEITDSVE